MQEITRILTPAVLVQSQLSRACDCLNSSIKTIVATHSSSRRSKLYSESLNIRLRKNVNIVKALNKSLESKQQEKETDPDVLKLLEQVSHLRLHVDSLEGIQHQMHQEEELYIHTCYTTQEIVKQNRKQLKDIYRHSIELSHIIDSYSFDLSESHKLATSFSLSSFSKQNLHKKTQSFLRDSRDSHQTQSIPHNYSHQKLRIRKERNSFSNILLKSVEPSEMQIIFKQGINILMKSLGPMKRSQSKTQTCKSSGHKAELIPSWELFKSWPVKKVISLLSLYREVLKELISETFINEMRNDFKINSSMRKTCWT